MEQKRLVSADSPLLQQAFQLSVIGTVIADALQDDYPIVYVNPAFERLTGYGAAETLGRNCRFLQGEDRDQPEVQELRDALREDQAVNVTLRNYRKDGSLFYNEVTLSPLRDEAGQVTHYVGYQNDVTAREEAALQTAQAHQLLHSTLERVTDGLAFYDQDLNFTHLNAAAARIPGQRAEDLIGKNLLTTFPDLVDSPAVQAILRAREAGTTQSVVTELFGRWIDATAYPAPDGVSVFTRDITEWYQTQKQLLRSEARFHTIFQACPISIVIARAKDLRYIDANPEFVRQSGYSREEVIGHTPFDLNLWVDPLEFEEVGRTLREQGEVHHREVRFRLKSGKVADAVISIVSVMLGEEPCLVTLVRDITTDKHARRELQASEEQYRRLAAELQRTLDLSLDMITTLDVKGNFVTMSAASRQLLGYAPEELIGRSFQEFVHPDDRARTEQEGISMTGRQDMTVVQNRYVHKNGSVVWLEWSAVMLPGDSLMYCVVRDITARRAAEEDQAYLAAIVQASQDAILGVNLDGTIRSWNTGAEQLYGYTALEAIGQPVTLIIPSELHAEEADILERTGRGERPSPFKSVRTAKDGHRIPVLVRVSAIRDRTGGVIGVSKVSQDISEREAAEAQIRALNESLQQQLLHLTGVREVDQMIASSSDLSLTLDRILDNVEQQLEVDAATLLLLDPHTLDLEYASTRGFTMPLPRSTVKLGSELAGQVALTRKPLWVPHLPAASLSPSWQEALTSAGLVTYYGAPLMAKGKVVGVIEVLHRVPFEPSDMWLERFDMLRAQAAIAVDNAHLFRDLEQRNLQLRLAYDETIEGWARALDLRDKETEGHSRRVTEMTVALCKQLGLPPEELVEVRRGALLHDIGKMGIPDAVLLKPGKLTDEEWVLMKRHPEYAVALLSPIQFLRSALDIPEYHHEKWDGSGYPLGLSGEAIPLTARAFAVVDVYDALTSDRPYRTAWTPEQVLTHIEQNAGTHFDPRVVEAFMALIKN